MPTKQTKSTPTLIEILQRLAALHNYAATAYDHDRTEKHPNEKPTDGSDFATQAQTKRQIEQGFDALRRAGFDVPDSWVEPDTRARTDSLIHKDGTYTRFIRKCDCVGLRRVARQIENRIKSLKARPQEEARPKPARLSLNAKGRIVTWGKQRIPINSHGDYAMLAALVAAPAGFVSFADLLRIVKPDEVSGSVDFDEAPPEVRVGMTRIRTALKAVGCPWRIKAEKGNGYRLLKPA